MSFALASLHVYPVKGLQGIEVREAHCTERGLRHDRRFMVVDPAGEFLTQRSLRRMATIWTDLRDGALTLSAPDAGAVDVAIEPAGEATMQVRVWGSTVPALPASPAADAWLTDYLGHPCRLVYMPEQSQRYSNPKYAGPGRLVSFADGYACLVIGEASLADLNRRLAQKGRAALPMNRFRPNLVVSGSDAYAEDGWREVRIGGAVLGAAKPCGRCEVTTTDQATGEVRGPEPLLTLGSYRNSSEFGIMFGMNFVALETGSLRVGDRVEAA